MGYEEIFFGRSTLLARFHKQHTVPTSFILSVSLYVRMCHRVSHWTDFSERKVTIMRRMYQS